MNALLQVDFLNLIFNCNFDLYSIIIINVLFLRHRLVGIRRAPIWHLLRGRFNLYMGHQGPKTAFHAAHRCRFVCLSGSFSYILFFVFRDVNANKQFSISFDWLHDARQISRSKMKIPAGAHQVKFSKLTACVLATAHDCHVKIWDIRVCLLSSALFIIRI